MKIKEKVLKKVTDQMYKDIGKSEEGEERIATEKIAKLVIIYNEQAISLTLSEAEKEFKKDLLSTYSEGHEKGEKEKLSEVDKVIMSGIVIVIIIRIVKVVFVRRVMFYN